MTLLIWAGTDEWQAESAEIHPAENHFAAHGVQLGASPLPYRLDYRLETVAGWVTGTFDVAVAGDGWRRSLHLARDAGGGWTCEAEAEGDPGLPPPGCDPGLLAAALDCDLGRSPLTNTMPVLRHGLHRTPGAADFTMALVSVPDLAVEPSPQRYEHVRTTADGAIVGFSSGSFSAELTLDAAGFLLDYSGLARRLH
jgi:hypothetical protein